jgi:hypothetical protein
MRGMAGHQAGAGLRSIFSPATELVHLVVAGLCLWLMLVALKAVAAPAWLGLQAGPDDETVQFIVIWTVIAIATYPVFIWVGWQGVLRGRTDRPLEARVARARQVRLAVALGTLLYLFAVYTLLVGIVHVKGTGDREADTAPATLPIHPRHRAGS